MCLAVDRLVKFQKMHGMESGKSILPVEESMISGTTSTYVFLKQTGSYEFKLELLS